jgi:hypothetical protein
MNGDETTSRQHLREEGRRIHRRENRQQILLPFIGGLLFILGIFLFMALPTDPVWRLRASAVSDFLYLVFCQVPLIVCSLLAYFIVVAGIWGMNKLHNRTEHPLVRLENLVAGLANRIESITDAVNNRALNWRTKAEQILHFMNIFDTNPNTGTPTQTDTTESETS